MWAVNRRKLTRSVSLTPCLPLNTVPSRTIRSTLVIVRWGSHGPSRSSTGRQPRRCSVAGTWQRISGFVYSIWNMPQPQFESELLSPLALSILELLDEEPMHPYEMATKMRTRHHDEFIRLNFGTLYHSVEVQIGRASCRGRG